MLLQSLTMRASIWRGSAATPQGVTWGREYVENDTETIEAYGTYVTLQMVKYVFLYCARAACFERSNIRALMRRAL
jgi:hypothetical protein